MERALERWLGAIPLDRLDTAVPKPWREKFTEALLNSDPQARTRTPAALRAPNGSLMVSRDYWRTGKPFYDPSRINVPTLVIHGDRDRDIPTPINLAYFAQLTNAPKRRFIEIGEGTHMLMLEQTRDQLFAEIELFLRDAIATT
jgi:pimeloyl-ACP methyl ester carboxylesterase